MRSHSSRINQIKPVLIEMTTKYEQERKSSWSVSLKEGVNTVTETVASTFWSLPGINKFSSAPKPVTATPDQKASVKEDINDKSNLQRYEFCKVSQKAINDAKTPLDLIKLCYSFGQQGRKAFKEAWLSSETCDWANGMRSTIIHLMTTDTKYNVFFEAELKLKKELKNKLELDVKQKTLDILTAMKLGKSEIEVQKLENELKDLTQQLNDTILDLADLNDTDALMEAIRLQFFKGFKPVDRTKNTAALVDTKYEDSVNHWIPKVYQRTYYRVYFKNHHYSDTLPTFEAFFNQHAVGKRIENEALTIQENSSESDTDDTFVTPTPTNSPAANLKQLSTSAGNPPPIPPRPPIAIQSTPNPTPTPELAKSNKLVPTTSPLKKADSKGQVEAQQSDSKNVSGILTLKINSTPTAVIPSNRLLEDESIPSLLQSNSGQKAVTPPASSSTTILTNLAQPLIVAAQAPIHLITSAQPAKSDDKENSVTTKIPSTPLANATSGAGLFAATANANPPASNSGASKRKKRREKNMVPK